MTDVEKLLEGLRIVSQMMTDDVIKNATTEQLFEYNKLITKIEARLDSIS